MVQLKPLTQELFAQVLRLNAGEQAMVGSAENTLSYAWLYKEEEELYVVCDEEVPVGLMMLEVDAEEPHTAFLWRFMIDQKKQGQGYGTQAMRCLLDMLRQREEISYITLNIIRGNERAARLYEKFGFQKTGREEDGEIEMKLSFNRPVPFSGIRPVRLADAADLEELCRASLGYSYPVANQLARILHCRENQLFAACDQGKLAGYIHLQDYQVIYAEPMKNILGLAVFAQFRGRGWGRALLRAAENRASADGCAGVRVVSGVSRTKAHEFYRHCGYEYRKDQKNFCKAL